jgi:hypothetical protein
MVSRLPWPYGETETQPPRMPKYSPRRYSVGTDLGGEDFYSVDDAARILKLTPGRIRQMLRAGELDGIPPEEGSGRDLVEDGRHHIGVQQS